MRETRKRKRDQALAKARGQIDIPPFDTSVKPGDDFFRYVNGKWLKHIPIPSFRSSFGVSEEIELGIQTKLQKILDESIHFSTKGLKPKSKEEVMKDLIGRLGLSCLRPGKQKFNLETLRLNLQSFQCIRDRNDVVATLAKLNKYGIFTFLSFSIYQNTPFLVPGSLGLPDDSYYKAAAPGKSRTLLAYVQLCKKVSEELEIPDIASGVQVESLLSEKIAQMKDEIKEKKTGLELKRLFPEIPWDIFFSEAGLKSWKDTVFQCNLRYIKFFQKCLKSWPLENWKQIFILHTILDALPLLPAPYDEYHFEFFGKKLRGQIEKLPQDELFFSLCKDILRVPLSYLYTKKYLDFTRKQKITNFVEHIRSLTINHMKDSWLEESTKKVAIKKLQSMNLSISHPSTFPDLDIPFLHTEKLLYNVYCIREMNFKEGIDSLGKKYHPTEYWEEPPYAVNAYYNNETNQFILPAGSVLEPFYYDSKEKMGWNYGGLGAVIGHEMTHAFDIDGKEYNEKGERKNWWTLKDTREYNKRTKRLVDLFDSQKILGKPVDGFMTLSENLSDLGGLAIALDALKETIKHASEEEKKKQFFDFFVSYAVSWRVKERPRKVVQGLFLDVHAPTELRVNLVVSQFSEWYELFNVITKNTYYFPPEERITIF
jgi:putative endopeptidase